MELAGMGVAKQIARSFGAYCATDDSPARVMKVRVDAAKQV